MASKGELIEAYVKLRAATRMYDARNSTSYEEEFEHCYRHGCPDPSKMSEGELQAEIDVCLESLGIKSIEEVDQS